MEADADGGRYVELPDADGLSPSSGGDEDEDDDVECGAGDADGVRDDVDIITACFFVGAGLSSRLQLCSGFDATPLADEFELSEDSSSFRFFETVDTGEEGAGEGDDMGV